MNEITMPADLAAAMNMLGGVECVNSTDGTGFGDILGQLMNGSENAVSDALLSVVPVVSEEEAPVQELPEEETTADALMAMLSGDENAVLPEVFDAEGEMAFMETVERFLDGRFSVSDIRDIWAKVPDEEKEAYADMLRLVFSEGEFRISDADGKEDTFLADESLKAVVAMVMKTADRTPVLRKEQKADETLAPYFMQGMNLVEFRADISDESISSADVQSMDSAMVDVITGDIPERENTAEAQSSQIVEVINDTDSISENIQNVYDKISEADTEEIVSFCKTLADELKAEVITEKDTAADADVPYAYEDSRQAFMARVSRPFEAEITEKTVPVVSLQGTAVQTARVQELTFSEPEQISEEIDISSQIMERIDLYEDIFSEGFTGREITMKLAPEELGELEIKIRRSGDGIEISFTAQKAEAAELIGDRASQLAEAVAARGIKLKEMYVSEKIVINESDGNSMGENTARDEGFYGGAADSSSSGRRFTFGSTAAAGETEDADDGITEQVYNREAKLWVSA